MRSNWSKFRKKSQLKKSGPRWTSRNSNSSNRSSQFQGALWTTRDRPRISSKTNSRTLQGSRLAILTRHPDTPSTQTMTHANPHIDRISSVKHRSNSWTMWSTFRQEGIQTSLTTTKTTAWLTSIVVIGITIAIKPSAIAFTHRFRSRCNGSRPRPRSCLRRTTPISPSSGVEQV